MIFAVVGFFSYRFFRTYAYYELVIISYEALVLMAFLALMLAYVGWLTDEQTAVMRSKEKRRLPWPLGCVRFRPCKPYFLHALNASVLQHAFLRPPISIIGMVCESYHVLGAHMALSKCSAKRTNPLHAFWQAAWYWDFFQDVRPS